MEDSSSAPLDGGVVETTTALPETVEETSTTAAFSPFSGPRIHFRGGKLGVEEMGPFSLDHEGLRLSLGHLRVAAERLSLPPLPSWIHSSLCSLPLPPIDPATVVAGGLGATAVWVLRGGGARAVAGAIRAAAGQEMVPTHQEPHPVDLNLVQHHQLGELEAEARNRQEALRQLEEELHASAQRLQLLQHARSRLIRPSTNFRQVRREELLEQPLEQLSELLEQWEKGVEEDSTVVNPSSTPQFSGESAELARHRLETQEIREVSERWGYYAEDNEVKETDVVEHNSMVTEEELDDYD